MIENGKRKFFTKIHNFLVLNTKNENILSKKKKKNYKSCTKNITKDDFNLTIKKKGTKLNQKLIRLRTGKAKTKKSNLTNFFSKINIKKSKKKNKLNFYKLKIQKKKVISINSLKTKKQNNLKRFTQAYLKIKNKRVRYLSLKTSNKNSFKISRKISNLKKYQGSKRKSSIFRNLMNLDLKKFSSYSLKEDEDFRFSHFFDVYKIKKSFFSGKLMDLIDSKNELVI